MRFAASPGFMGAYGLVDTFDPNQLGQQIMAGQSAQRRAAMSSDAAIRGTELQADAMIEAAKYGADATAARGAAQGQMSMMGGAIKGLSGLGGTLKNRFGSNLPGTLPGRDYLPTPYEVNPFTQAPLTFSDFPRVP